MAQFALLAALAATSFKTKIPALPAIGEWDRFLTSDEGEDFVPFVEDSIDAIGEMDRCQRAGEPVDMQIQMQVMSFQMGLSFPPTVSILSPAGILSSWKKELDLAILQAQNSELAGKLSSAASRAARTSKKVKKSLADRPYHTALIAAYAAAVEDFIVDHCVNIFDNLFSAQGEDTEFGNSGVPSALVGARDSIDLSIKLGRAEFWHLMCMELPSMPMGTTTDRYQFPAVDAAGSIITPDKNGVAKSVKIGYILRADGVRGRVTKKKAEKVSESSDSENLDFPETGE